MKLIFRIAKTELANFFYSPIAWLIPVIFACQVGVDFMDPLKDIVTSKLLGREIRSSITQTILAGNKGLLSEIQSTLYLYIPLLTMGLLSREFSSGSIKLLYSSPVTSSQIVLGKYLAMVVYALILIAILALPLVVLYSSVGLAVVETGVVLSGLLGMFLLICAYSAIGLYMSSLTSYQIVAGIATFSVLALLNFIGGIGQEMAFVREITYWLSIKGRADEMIRGVICSDDIVYFFAVIGLFLTFSILRIQDQKIRFPRVIGVSRYLAAALVVVTIGYISSRPHMLRCYDTISTKRNTLSLASQEIVGKLVGPLTITTFCNILDRDFSVAAPRSVKDDQKRFRKYALFKPEIKFKYVYYFGPAPDTSIYKRYPGLSLEQIAKKIALSNRFNFKKLKTVEEVEKIVDLKQENYSFVRLIERGTGERSFLRIYNDLLRHPGEPEISAAFKRLTVEPVKAGFLTGHGERDIHKSGDRDYSSFATSLRYRGSMINQGFDLVPLDLKNMDDIPQNIDLLIIAEMREPLSAGEEDMIDRYIARGDNMMILADAFRQKAMNPLLSKLGVRIKEGVLVQKSALYSPALITSIGTDRTGELSNSDRGFFGVLQTRRNNVITMYGTAALDTVPQNTGFDYIPLLASDPATVWLDTKIDGFNDDTAINPADTIGPNTAHLTGLAAVRQVGEKQQRIMVLADADCFSNSELFMNREGIFSRNMNMVSESFSWLYNGEFAVKTPYPPNRDTNISLSADNVANLKIVYVIVLPLMIAIVGILIWLRRRKG